MELKGKICANIKGVYHWSLICSQSHTGALGSTSGLNKLDDTHGCLIYDVPYENTQ